MKNKKGLFLMAILVVVLALVVAGCSSTTEADKTPAPADKAPAEKAQVAAAVMPTIIPAYVSTTHAKINLDQGARNGCLDCHNGASLETGKNKIEDLENVVGATAACTTCHGENGQKLMKSSSIEKKSLGTLSFGKGNLCANCHFGRDKQPDQKSAPHRSPQADFLMGKSGAGVEGTASVHTSVPDTCVGCHLAKDEKGIPNHAFAVDEKNIKNACGTCHADLKTVNRTVKSDYDGNGKAEGIQDEVEGLLELVKKAVDDKLVADNTGFTQFVDSHGKIYFADKDGKHPDDPNAPSEVLYNAAWNYFLVESDGSMGVHNPAYAVKLLQQSYKSVTGKDVPNAVLK